jgi:hypothetical protein
MGDHIKMHLPMSYYAGPDKNSMEECFFITLEHFFDVLTILLDPCGSAPKSPCYDRVGARHFCDKYAWNKGDVITGGNIRQIIVLNRPVFQVNKA